MLDGGRLQAVQQSHWWCAARSQELARELEAAARAHDIAAAKTLFGELSRACHRLLRQLHDYAHN